MNLFYLDSSPKIVAQYHTNSHCVKMILETAQLLSTAHQFLDGYNPNLYKATHVNHPVCKWVRESVSNYRWTYELFVELCKEYEYRYGKIHKTFSNMGHLLKEVPINIIEIGFTKPALAMPDEFKCSDPILSYRQYYIGAKQHLAKWKNRETPTWYIVR